MTKEELNYDTNPTCYSCNHCYGNDIYWCDLFDNKDSSYNVNVEPNGICDEYECDGIN